MTPSVADLLHRFGDLLADDFVAVGRDRADLGDLILRDLLRVGLEIFDDAATARSMPRFRSIGLAPAATDGAFRTIAWARTVAVVVPSPAMSAGLGGDLVDHLGAHVLELVLELDFLRDRHAVLGDARRAERLLDDDVAALG